MHEEVWRGTVAEARIYFDAVRPRGEFTLVIGGAPQEHERWDEDRVQVALDELLAQGMRRSTAARNIAEAAGWRRSDVYRLGLGARNQAGSREKSD
jgi:16S rRNA (cytidine1402-2'-O)-methyltransferase